MKSTPLSALLLASLISSAWADQPVITSPADGLTLEQAPGSQGILTIEFENPDANKSLPWEILFEGEPADPLERVMEELEDSPEEILSLLPGRAFFEGGEGGIQFDLADGYRVWGNQLRPDQTELRYSNFFPATETIGEGTVRYATAKLPGLFIFSGQLEGISEFSVGNSPDNSSSPVVTTGEFTLEIAGITWRAFIKTTSERSHVSVRPRRPSLNQLILVPDAPGLTLENNPQNAIDGPTINNLPASTPLHYLYFSRLEGATYGRSVFEDLATTFLTQILPGPRWATPSSTQGMLLGGETNSVDLPLDAGVAGVGTHTAESAVVRAGTARDSLEPSAWRSLILTVPDPDFLLSLDKIELNAIEGTEVVRSEITTTSSGDLEISAESSDDWLSATPLANGRWQIEANTSGFVSGTHLGHLTFNDGTSSLSLPVWINISARQFISLLADPVRPRLYALSKVAEDPGYLLVHDTVTRSEIASIPLGLEPVDCVLDKNASELFVLNAGDPSVTRIDLARLKVRETIPLTRYVREEGELDSYDSQIAKGPGSILYYTDEAALPTVHVLDLETKAILQTIEIEPTPDVSGLTRLSFGEIATDPSLDHLFGWIGWDGRGSRRNYLTRFDIDEDGTLSGFVREQIDSDHRSNRRRDRTPYLFSNDGGVQVVKEASYAPDDFGSELVGLADEAYALTPGGELVGLRRNRIYNQIEQSFLDAPGSPPYAFTPDYAWFTSVGDEGDLIWTDLDELIPPTDLGLEFKPADEGGVVLPGELHWPPVAGARHYRLFIGTDPILVEGADSGSPEFQGTFSGTSAPLPDYLEPGQSYYWKVLPDVGGTPDSEHVRSFTVLPVELERTSVETSTVAGATRLIEPFSVATTSGTSWELSTTESWISMENSTGSGNGTPIIVIDSSEFTEGSYLGEVILTVDGIALPIPVALSVSRFSVRHVQALPDEETIWVSSQGQGEAGFLVAYNIETERYETVIPSDVSIEDFTVHRHDNRIYLAPFDSSIIHGYDLTTLERVFSLHFDEESDPGRITGISPGTEGRLIVEILEPNEPFGPRKTSIRLIDTSSGAQLDEFDFGDIPSGTGVSTPDGSTYYYGGSKPDTVGVSRFDLSGDRFVEVGNNFYLGDFSSPVLLSADGTRVAWNGGIFDTDLNLLGEVEDRLYAISGDATFVASRNDLYNSINGLSVESLPIRTSLKTFDGSGEVLYSFASDVVVAIRLSDSALLPDRDVVPGLADGTTVALNEVNLSWESEATATSYDLYFGTDRDQLEAADQSSSSYLGTVTSGEWDGPLPSISLGGIYYWRVDMNGVDQNRMGSVLEFSVLPVAATPPQVILPVLVDQPITPQSISIQSTGGDVWSATASVPWIVLGAETGALGEDLSFTINPDSLLSGIHLGIISITSGGETTEVSVELDLVDPDFVARFLVDPNRPRIYGLIPSPFADPDDLNHLMAINSETAEIEEVIRIGQNVTDLVIDPVTDRLIATNHQHPVTRAFDLTTLEELPPLELGPDVYSLEIDPVRRRLITETWRGDVAVRILDLETLTPVGGFRARDGVARYDPAQGFYYRADNFSGASNLERYDLNANPPVRDAELNQHSASVPEFLITPDGSRIVVRDTVFAPDFEIVNVLPQEALDLSPGGELAVSRSGLHWLDDPFITIKLPFPPDLAAFTADGDRLLLFNNQEDRLESISLDSLIELPSPNPRDGQWLDDSPAELAWPAVEGASSYTVTLSSPLQGSLTFDDLTDPRLSLPVVFKRGAYVTWSVAAEFPDRDPVTTRDYHFGVRIPLHSIVEGAVPLTPDFGPKHLLSRYRLRSNPNAHGLRTFDQETGDAVAIELNPVRRNSGIATEGQRTLIDRFRGYHLLPFQEVGENSTGQIFSFKANLYDRARTTTVPRPAGRSNGFGSGFAASGGLLLASGPISDNNEQMVVAYLSEPEFVQTQIFRHSEEREFDNFGSSIALNGNTAALTSDGRYNTPNGDQLPVIFIFERDPATGQWQEKQKLEVPEAFPNTRIRSLEMNDRFLIGRNPETSEVLIYQVASDGSWSHQTTLSREVEEPIFPLPPNDNTFGTGIALFGNRLFLGDPNARIDSGEGAVFSFIFDGEQWQEGVPVIPPNPVIDRREFGLSVTARDRWLFVGSETVNSGSSFGDTGHLFEFAPEANRTPFIHPSSVTQALSGRPFELLVEAEDPDGNEGLLMQALHKPGWMDIEDLGNGIARLTGTPTGDPGSHTDLQFKVTDPDGAMSYEVFRLTLVADSDLPALTLEPEDLLLSEGQDLLLRAETEGTGPFTWQWFHNNELIPEASRSSLAIAEATFEAGGEYRAEVSNSVGRASSRTALVTITEAGRDAGPWSASEGGMRRSGFHPARLKRHTFVPAWSKRVPLAQASQAAVAGNRVVLSGVISSGSILWALDLTDGDPLWSRDFDTRDLRSNPPSIHNGVVYYQESDGSNSRIWALSADDGGVIWEQPWISQLGTYRSPAVSDRGVWIGGGYGDGLYGFDLDGTQRFFQELPQQYVRWTPILSGDRLFTLVEGTLREHDPDTGALLWSAVNDGSENYYPGTIQKDRAFISTSTGLFGIDLIRQEVSWFQAEPSNIQPAVFGDQVYAITEDRVLSFDREEGNPGPEFVIPSGNPIESFQPLLLHDHLLISTETQTFVFDLVTTELLQVIGIGGNLSYGNGRLIIVESNGHVHAWFPNGAPTFTAGMPTEVNSGEAAPPTALEFGPFVSDPDPEDSLTWAISGVTRPEIFNALEVDPASGRLSVTYNPWQAGDSEVTVSVTDLAGNVTESVINFTVPPHPLPSLEVAESFELNRLTGLYEHRIKVTNSAAREIAGFDLAISNLPDGTRVYGASPTVDGAATLQQRRVLAAGASVTLQFDYFLPIRGTQLEPDFAATIVTEPEETPVATETGLVIDLCLMIEDGVLIEFTATPGRVYEIQYSSDNVTWKASPTRLRAGGNRVQWVDRGPPQTDSPPLDKSSRFYRVRELAENE